MQIVEMGDCSMVIMKDSEDPPWVSVGDVYREVIGSYKKILIDKEDQLTFNYLEASDAIYTSGRLVLFFKDTIPSRFQVHDKVILTTSY